jgi:hypothetical protein
MNINQVDRKRRRLPGEIAFDRCLLPLVALSFLNIIFGGIEWRLRPSGPLTEAQLDAEMPPPLWHEWLWFALGLLLVVLWFRAVVTLVRTWRDPSSRVLRFSSSVLLIPFAVATYRLLLTPFQ